MPVGGSENTESAPGVSRSRYHSQETRSQVRRACRTRRSLVQQLRASAVSPRASPAHHCFRSRLLSSKPSFSSSTIVTPWLTAYPLNSLLNSVVTLKLSVSASVARSGGRSLLLRCDDAPRASGNAQIPLRISGELEARRIFLSIRKARNTSGYPIPPSPFQPLHLRQRRHDGPAARGSGSATRDPHGRPPRRAYGASRRLPLLASDCWGARAKARGAPMAMARRPSPLAPCNAGLPRPE